MNCITLLQETLLFTTRLNKIVTLLCLFIETTFITRNQTEKISQILLLQNIVMGLLAKSAFIFKPARPAFATLNLIHQRNNWMKRNDTICRISIGEKSVCAGPRSIFYRTITRDRGHR